MERGRRERGMERVSDRGRGGREKEREGRKEGMKRGN